LEERDMPGIADQEDEDAAIQVFLCQQHELRCLGAGFRLEGDAFCELSGAVQWTRRVLIDRCTKKGAKLLELELTGGEPLGICVGRGTVSYRFDRHRVGRLPVLGYGCIFLDRADVSGGRAYWRQWCDEHPPSKDQAARSLRTSRTPPRFRGG
jgi:hypothetical protein